MGALLCACPSVKCVRWRIRSIPNSPTCAQPKAGRMDRPPRTMLANTFPSVFDAARRTARGHPLAVCWRHRHRPPWRLGLAGVASRAAPQGHRSAFVGDILGVVICQVHHSFTKRREQAVFLHLTYRDNRPYRRIIAMPSLIRLFSAGSPGRYGSHRCRPARGCRPG